MHLALSKPVAVSVFDRAIHVVMSALLGGKLTQKDVLGGQFKQVLIKGCLGAFSDYLLLAPGTTVSHFHKDATPQGLVTQDSH